MECVGGHTHIPLQKNTKNKQTTKQKQPVLAFNNSTNIFERKNIVFHFWR